MEKAKQYYEEGIDNETTDTPLAVIMFRKAADMGHPRAQARLACLLWRGCGGLPQDRREALQWTATALRDDTRLTPSTVTCLRHFERISVEEKRQAAIDAQSLAFTVAIEVAEQGYREEARREAALEASHDSDESSDSQDTGESNEAALGHKHESDRRIEVERCPSNVRKRTPSMVAAVGSTRKWLPPTPPHESLLGTGRGRDFAAYALSTQHDAEMSSPSGSNPDEPRSSGSPLPSSTGGWGGIATFFGGRT